MKQKSIVSKVAVDLFREQMKWSLWFLSFLVFAHIVHQVIVLNFGEAGDSVGDFLTFSYGSSKVYMLVIGIVSAFSFLARYVNRGITRKDFYKGAVLAVIGLSFAIAFLATLFKGIEYLIMDVTKLSHLIDYSSGSNFGDSTIYFPVGITDSTHLDFSGNWFLALFLYSINILTYYLIGWLIGAGYYRFGWIIGFGFIALSLLLVTTLGFLWEGELGDPIAKWLSIDAVSFPLSISIVGNILLIGIALWLIRLLTRRVAIKI